MFRKSKDHLDDVHETYWEHFSFASNIAFICFKAGTAALMHAICPALFQTTGSREIFKMNDMMLARKKKTNGQ